MKYDSEQMRVAFSLAIKATEAMEDNQEREQIFIRLFDLSAESYMLRRALMESDLWVRYMELDLE